MNITVNILTIVILSALAITVILGLYIAATYNVFVKLRVRVDEAWSDITVQLKRRADLIPALVDTVRGYASHEKEIFEAVTKARAETVSAGSPAEASQAENHLQQALKSIFAVAEAYPELQASENFLQLQGELVETENKIQSARRYYNGGVRELNTKVKSFPSNIVAAMFKIVQRDFFEVAEAEAIQAPPKIEF